MFGARRSKSLYQRKTDDNEEDDSMEGTSDDNNISNGIVGNWLQPKRQSKPSSKPSSFHARSQHERSKRATNQTESNVDNSRQSTNKEEEEVGDDDPSSSSLHETIANLKASVLTHATSSAETMGHFTTLQKAHDTLYEEHVHLQEQMDDAVELLKYLKEEKGNYESKIDKLTKDLAATKDAMKDVTLVAMKSDATKDAMNDTQQQRSPGDVMTDVVSLTIENLTKEKMDLEHRWKEERVRGDDLDEALHKMSSMMELANEEWKTKVDGLEKVREAYDLQTKSQLDGNKKVTLLQKERGELLERVNMLEEEAKQSKLKEEEAKKRKTEREIRHEEELSEMEGRLEEERIAYRALHEEKIQMESTQNEMKDELSSLKEKQRHYEETTIVELKSLREEKVQIPHLNARNEREQLADDDDDHDDETLERKIEMLTKANGELLQEKKDMALYVDKMEETLMTKDELLEHTKEELELSREEIECQLTAMRSLQTMLDKVVLDDQEKKKETKEDDNGDNGDNDDDNSTNMKIELAHQLASLQKQLEEKDESHALQAKSLRQQAKHQCEIEFERERESTSRTISLLRNELAANREELHRSNAKLESLQSRMEGEGSEREELHRSQLKLLRVGMEEEANEREEAHRVELREMRERLVGVERRQSESVAAAVDNSSNSNTNNNNKNKNKGDALDRSSRFSSDNSGHNELLLENESLKYKLKEMEDLMEEQNHTTMQRGEVHAQLEKEMQERLAKRIAVQLHEQKIAMEAQIRGELAAEYQNNHTTRATHHHTTVNDCSSSSSSIRSLPNNSAAVNELEEQLRIQLEQVKEERERWKREQEEIQIKVLNSQQQFSKVREGFKKKIDKEKAKNQVLQKSKEDQQRVIDRLSAEHQSVMSQFEELQEQITSQKESSEQQSRQHWEDEKATLLQQYHQIQLEQMSSREEQYATQVHDLQSEINDLLNEQNAHEKEYNVWEFEKENMLERYNNKVEEFQRAMDDLEQLNLENAGYLKKVDKLENQMEELRNDLNEAEESRVKFSVLQIEHKQMKQDCEKRVEQNENLMRQMEQLNTENGELQQQILNSEQKMKEMSTNLSRTEEERNKLHDSLRETSDVCLELESKLSSYKREKEEMLEEHETKIDDLEELLDRTEAESASVREAVVAAEKEKAETAMAEMDLRHQDDVAEMAKKLADSTSQVSKLTDQLAKVSMEKARFASDLVKMQEEGKDLMEDVRQLESSVELLTAERDSANSRLNELLSTYERTEQALSSLMSNAEENRRENDQLALEKKEAIEALSAERDSANARVTELLSTYEITGQALSSLSSNTAESKKEIDRLTAEKRDAIESLTAERDAANARVTELLSRCESAQQSLSSNVDESKRETARLTAEKRDAIESLSAERDAANERVAKLLSRCERTEEALSSLTSNVEESKREIARLLEEKQEAVESISAERDAANVRVTKLLSSCESTDEAMSYPKSIADENKEIIDRLTTEKESAIAKVHDLEAAAKKLEAHVENLAFELRVSTSETNKLKTQLEAANRRQPETENEATDKSVGSSNSSLDEDRKENEAQNNPTNDDYDDYEAKIQILQSEVDGLKETNNQLSTKNTDIQTQNARASSQNPEASVNENLMKDLVEVNNDLHKLKMELRDSKDNNAVLEEAVLDIQVEKEDLQLENEELASKLTDLTTQAKKMLLNNESLEEAIADQQIEYEDRILELESQLEEQCEDDDLRQKHEAALETIVKLKAGIDVARQEVNEAQDVDSLKRVEKENLELRRAINHLSSENDAAKEIKFIVLELRAKNLEMTETLRVSEAKNKAAADMIETLQVDNCKLRNDISLHLGGQSLTKLLTAEAHEDRLVPFEHGTEEPAEMSDIEAELQRYKSMVSQMKDSNSFCHQLSVLTGKSEIPQREPSDDVAASAALDNLPHTNSNEGALVPLNRHTSRDHLNDAAINQGAILVTSDTTEASSYAPSYNQLHLGEVEDQIRNLTNENVQLAQRLGGAVAEKEFAMSTLKKLKAKMEELIERNDILANAAGIKGIKGQHSSRDSTCYSRQESAENHHVLMLEDKGRDPDAISRVKNDSTYTETEASNHPTSVKRHDNYSSSKMHHDDPSAYSDMSSTILSHELSTKKLEPESASDIGNPGGGEFFKRNSREEKDQRVDHHNKAPTEEANSTSGPKLVKVPGGEYFGQLNERGHKHGNGKMKYDNGNEYDGQWKNNKRDGKGITKYASGNVYTGTWKTGKRHGFGVFHIRKTGDVYRGNWAHGLKSGPGVYEYADGELDVSYYEEDIRVGEGVRWSASRHQASRLVDGQLVGKEGDMMVEDAMKLTKDLGFVV